MSCPAGHKLPNMTPTGQCTPIYCGAVEGGLLPPAKKARKARKTLAASNEQTAERVSSEQVVAQSAEERMLEEEAANPLNRAASSLARRQEFFKVPQGLSGDEAEKYADTKLINLLPDAVAELEYRLKLGDDDQRWSAARQVFESTGRGKKDIPAGGASPIIILNGSGITQLPWSTKKSVVEGEVVSNESK